MAGSNDSSDNVRAKAGVKAGSNLVSAISSVFLGVNGGKVIGDFTENTADYAAVAATGDESWLPDWKGNKGDADTSPPKDSKDKKKG
jgi:hypothetical protein